MMNPQDLGQLVEKHAAALVLFARQWCVTPEDVVQDAFIKLAAQKTVPEHVVPWLYRVVRNGAISAWRSARRRRHYEQMAATRKAGWFVDHQPATLDQEAVTIALQSLPVEQRELLVAHIWGGLSFEQIASVRGGSASTAFRHYMNGLTALREKLGVSCPTKSPTLP